MIKFLGTIHKTLLRKINTVQVKYDELVITNFRLLHTKMLFFSVKIVWLAVESNQVITSLYGHSVVANKVELKPHNVIFFARQVRSDNINRMIIYK